MPAEVGSKVNTKALSGEVREGEVIIYDPDDDEMTYKVKFAEGDPPADWFKRCCVALLGEDFPLEPVKTGTDADQIQFSSAAPYIAEFYRTFAAIARKSFELGNLTEMVEQNKQIDDEVKAWYESQGKALIEKSFHLHDSKKTGVLDKEEAAVFCEHMFSASAAIAKYLEAKQVQTSVRMEMEMLNSMMSMMGGKGKGKGYSQGPEMKEKIRMRMQEVNARMQTVEDTYLATKDAKNAAAFKVLDSNGDGSIQLTELVDAFEPGSAKDKEFHKAIGLDMTGNDMTGGAKGNMMGNMAGLEGTTIEWKMTGNMKGSEPDCKQQ